MTCIYLTGASCFGVMVMMVMLFMVLMDRLRRCCISWRGHGCCRCRRWSSGRCVLCHYRKSESSDDYSGQQFIDLHFAFLFIMVDNIDYSKRCGNIGN